MEITLIIKAFLALVFVLGLLFVTVWGLKYCELKGAKNRFFQKMRSQRRLEIIENNRIDLRHKNLLYRCDTQEHRQ